MLEQFLDELPRNPGGCDRDVCVLAQPCQVPQRRGGSDVLAHGFRDTAVQIDARPFPGQIDFRAIDPGYVLAPCNASGNTLNEFPGDRRHRAVIRICPVELEHRELRGVAGVHSLIAEIAVDLEHSLKATHYRAL